MKIKITDTHKCDKFVAIFQQLKTLSSSLCWQIDEDSITVQGMDQGHVSMFQLVLGNTWFDTYEHVSGDLPVFHICSTLLAKFLNIRSDHQTIDISLDENADKIKIRFESDDKAEFNKALSLSLMDAEQESLNIPEMEYTAEFILQSKKLNSLVDQLSLMNDIVEIHCDEETIKLKTEGLEGIMEVSIPHDDIEEYIIDEDTSVDVSYSLNYMKKFCQYHRVSETVELQISEQYPLMVTYKLNALNYLKFYLAPKMDDNE